MPDGTVCETCSGTEFSCPDKGTTLATIVVPSGSWRTSAESTVIEECLTPEHCVGGPNVTEQCLQPGYGGPLCATCDEGFVRLQGDCKSKDLLE